MKNLLKVMLTAAAVTALAMILPHLAMAAPATPPPSPSIDSMYQEIQSFLNMILEVMQRILWPVLLMIGGLMKNDILFGAGMEERMLLIWVQIRNLVNILFVVILLGIALYNVVGGPKQEFQLKQILPKFVIALIAVNFSFIAVKIVLDTVNVMTTAIFALPISIDKEALGKTKVSEGDFQKQICEGLYGKAEEYDKGWGAADKNKNAMCDNNKMLKAEAKPIFEYFSASNGAAIMALQLQNIAHIDKVDNLTAPTLKNLLSNTMFSVVMFLIYGTAFVVLFVILLVRMVVLWVAIVLSPLMMITYALPAGALGSGGGGLDDFKKKFITTAIAPIPISLVLTIGYIMAMGLKTAKFSGDASLILGSTPIAMGVATSGLSTFQELIAAVGTAAVVWVGVFAAANGTYAQKAVDKIKSTVEGVGQFAMGAIQYAPIFPVATGGKSQNVSLGALQNLPNRMSQAQRADAENQTTFLMGSMKGGDYVRSSSLMRDAADREKYKKAEDATLAARQGMALAPNMVDKDGKGDDRLRTLGNTLASRTEVANQFDWTVSVRGKLKKTDKEERVLSREDLIKAMQSSESVLNQDDFNRWRNENIRGVTPPPPPETKTSGQTGKEGQPAIGAERAGTLAAAAGTAYGAGLTADEKMKVEAYKKTAADPKAKDAQKEKALKEAQSALQKLDAAQTGRSDLASTVSRAQDIGTIRSAINTRREQLSKANVAEAQQTAIIRQELSEADTVKNIKDRNGGSAVIDGVDFAAPPPAATPTTGAGAKPAAPAGGKPAAPGGDTPSSKKQPPENKPPEAKPPAPAAKPTKVGANDGAIEYANFHKWRWSQANMDWEDMGPT